MPSRVPHQASILICDGRKAIFAVNSGSPDDCVLAVQETLHAAVNPASREQGADRPGRVNASSDNRRSAVAAFDIHDAMERAFLTEVCGKFSQAVRQRQAKAVVIIAPPRAMAALRAGLDQDILALVTADLPKDLTKHSLADIQRLLSRI